MNKRFLHNVLDCIRKYKMIAEGDTIIVGVSGGIDSITLLYSLFFLKDELKCSLIVAHANHGLRGEQSDKEAELVGEIARKLKLPYVAEKLDVLGYMDKKGLSKQVAARELRYDFFERAARQLFANKIALGHTADDQAETVLMRLLRGSGMKGIGGMKAVRDKIIRPLIEIGRDEITEFAVEKDLRYVEDPSNLETYYLRNKIRLNLMPLLKQEYNPNLVETLKETAEIIRDEDEFLEDYCSGIFSAAASAEDRESIEIDVSKLKGLHIAIQRRIIRIALRRLKGELLKISAVHIKDMLDLIDKGASGKTLCLPDDIQVIYEYGRLKVRSPGHPSSGWVAGVRSQAGGIKFNISIIIPGETVLSTPSYKFKTGIISSIDSREVKDKYTAFFDMDKIEGELRVRNRIPGDIFRPSGMKGSKKLKEFFIDEKIPRGERDSIPLIVSGDAIVWIVGKRAGEYGKIDKDTKRILKIEALKI